MNNKSRAEYLKARRAENKRFFVKALGGQCRKCGMIFTDSTIDQCEFHHADSHSKHFNIATNLTSRRKCMFEVTKCILLCDDCHKALHHVKGLSVSVSDTMDFIGEVRE